MAVYRRVNCIQPLEHSMSRNVRVLWSPLTSCNKNNIVSDLREHSVYTVDFMSVSKRVKWRVDRGSTPLGLCTEQGM